MDSNIRQASQLIEDAVRGMTEEQLAWHQEGKWSTANILEHLSRAFHGTAKGLTRTLETGKPDCRAMTLKDRVQVLVVTGIGYFPRGRKSPQGVMPKGISAEEALNSIRKGLLDMDAVLAHCEEKFGASIKLLNHPVLGPLNLRQWRKFHYVHTRHHMKQVRALRAMQAGKSSRSAE